MLVIGHRGAAGHAPENTLLSVRRAVELGADGVEVDVRFVKGELLLLHDETLDRTTDGRGRVEDWDLPALRVLHAGGGDRIPFLREVLELLPSQSVLHAEMKGRGAAEAVAAFLGSAGAGGRPPLSRTVVSSFDPEQLVRLRRCEPRARIGLLFRRAPEDLESWAERVRPESLHLSSDGLTSEEVRRAHGMGLVVLAYTVNDRVGFEGVSASGADGLFTDYPDRICGFLAEKGRVG